MSTAIESPGPAPEPFRRGKSFMLSIFWRLVWVLVFAVVCLVYPDFRDLLWIVAAGVPAILIEIRYMYMRAYHPRRVPLPLFEGDPVDYERLIRLRRTLIAITFGVLLGGVAMRGLGGRHSVSSAFLVVFWVCFGLYLTVASYIKARNGLRTG